MSEPILASETRCVACARAAPNADGCEYPAGWYLDSDGAPVCSNCESAYRRIAGKLANLASELSDGLAEIELRRRSLRGSGTEANPHDCMEYAMYITTDGPIGHGWGCGKCGAFLQAG